MIFLSKYTATTEVYPYGHTCSLHDALPIAVPRRLDRGDDRLERRAGSGDPRLWHEAHGNGGRRRTDRRADRHELCRHGPVLVADGRRRVAAPHLREVPQDRLHRMAYRARRIW